MNEYSEGLRHGYEDERNAVREILELDVPDAVKLELITLRVESTPYVKREEIEVSS